MIQLNLLPDVKHSYIAANRTKRLVMFCAVLIAAVSIFVLTSLIIVVNVVQKGHMRNLEKDIAASVEQLKDPNLEKVLTIQNQITSLKDLHDKKPVATRLSEYLVQLTPSKASLSNITVDFEKNSMTFAGSADSLETVNKFVDTIKFTDYTYEKTTVKAFKNVVLASFSVASGQTTANQKVTFSITLEYDASIFDSLKSGTLVVPSIISTRSVTEKPTEGLFQPAPVTNQETPGDNL